MTTEMYAIQVVGAAVGMLLGYLTVSSYSLRKRAKAAEQRLAALEF